MRLKDRVTVVTGGGGAIGRVICQKTAEQGGKVAVIDIDPVAAHETIATLSQHLNESIAIGADITQKAQVQNMVSEVLNRFGHIDILVNNAGTSQIAAVTELEEGVWDRIMNLNLKGVFLCTQAVMPTMIDRHYGRIVNIASQAGKTGEAFNSAYSASKFGVVGFTQSIAQEVGKHNITVNAVCPGAVETRLLLDSLPQSANDRGMSPEEFLQKFFIDSTPMGRLAQPIDVAKAVVFLVSDEAEYITGSTLNVAGGREMH
ncbi:MAG: SDR family NAD(P)-dependent oxidoreductase [Planctomycetota bacterium]|jgi:NAD(P)-dependent dehydrogenase (short-subunit alcohol dehydrogenase family)